jgi:hypothetical protein
MIEGSGSVPLTNGSGSRRPKNIVIRIRIFYYNEFQVVCQLVTNPSVRGMLVDVGMPVMHRNVTYNCRVVFYNGQIIMIRPKASLSICFIFISKFCLAYFFS